MRISSPRGAGLDRFGTNVYYHCMTQVFPFGRGKRGSRQRLIVEFGKWGGTMTVHEVSIRILRTHEPDITVLKLGTAELAGKRSTFFTSQIFQVFEAGKQSIKDFRTIRKTNKIKIDKPIQRKYNATHEC